MHLQQCSTHLGFLRLCRGAKRDFGKWHSDFLCHGANSFRKSNVLELLNEAEDVTGNATSETVVKLPRGMHRERGRLLLVKWAQPGIILRSRLAQLHVLANNADDVRLLLDGIGKVAGIRHDKCSLLKG